MKRLARHTERNHQIGLLVYGLIHVIFSKKYRIVDVIKIDFMITIFRLME